MGFLKFQRKREQQAGKLPENRSVHGKKDFGLESHPVRMRFSRSEAPLRGGPLRKIEKPRETHAACLCERPRNFWMGVLWRNTCLTCFR